MPFLHAKDLTKEAFLGLIDQDFFPKGSFLMAFSPAEFRLEPFQFNELFFASSDQGRIFSAEFELKWRKIESLFRVVYLGDIAPPEGLEDHSKTIDGLERCLEELMLWLINAGKENVGIMQQALDHSKHGRLNLLVENWVDASGLARFSRYHSFKETTGER